MKILHILIVMYFTNIFAQNTPLNIQIEFLKEGNKINSKYFDIYFVVYKADSKVIFKPVIKNSLFIMPDMCENEKGHILIKYKKEIYAFGYNTLTFNQNMKLVLGIDKKPFNREYILTDDDVNNIKGITYVEFHPLERGDGTVTMMRITNYKLYLSESRKILE